MCVVCNHYCGTKCCAVAPRSTKHSQPSLPCTVDLRPAISATEPYRSFIKALYERTSDGSVSSSTPFYSLKELITESTKACVSLFELRKQVIQTIDLPTLERAKLALERGQEVRTRLESTVDDSKWMLNATARVALLILNRLCQRALNASFEHFDGLLRKEWCHIEQNSQPYIDEIDKIKALNKSGCFKGACSFMRQSVIAAPQKLLSLIRHETLEQFESISFRFGISDGIRAMHIDTSKAPKKLWPLKKVGHSFPSLHIGDEQRAFEHLYGVSVNSTTAISASPLCFDFDAPLKLLQRATQESEFPLSRVTKVLLQLTNLERRRNPLSHLSTSPESLELFHSFASEFPRVDAYFNHSSNSLVVSHWDLILVPGIPARESLERFEAFCASNPTPLEDRLLLLQNPHIQKSFEGAEGKTIGSRLPELLARVVSADEFTGLFRDPHYAALQQDFHNHSLEEVRRSLMLLVAARTLIDVHHKSLQGDACDEQTRRNNELSPSNTFKMREGDVFHSTSLKNLRTLLHQGLYAGELIPGLFLEASQNKGFVHLVDPSLLAVRGEDVEGLYTAIETLRNFGNVTLVISDQIAFPLSSSHHWPGHAGIFVGCPS
jgi:hypothetical protein